MGKEQYLPGQSPHERANAIRRNLTAAQAQQHTVVTTTGGKLNHAATTPSQVSTPAPPAVAGISLSGDPASDVTGTSVSASGSAAQAARADHTHALGIVPATKGGTNTDTSTKVVGTVPYFSVIGTWAFLAPNTTTTRMFLRATGTGSLGQAPAWDTLAAGDITSGTLADARLSFKRCIEWSGPSSLVTGADTYEVTLPGDFSSRALQRVQVRLQTTSSSGSFTIFLELSTASGAFAVAQTSDTFTIAAGSYETIVTSFSNGLTGSAGNKVRYNISALGTGPANLTIETEWL